MKFLADVNIPQSIVIYLTKTGHDVSDIKRQILTAKDTDLIKIAQKEQRTILTLDKDFLSLTQFPKYQVSTIVIRLKDLSPNHIIEHLKQLLKNQKEEILQSSVTIIKEETADSHPF
ncbi:MAG: DUF5615 family PIN-like protein [Patescibacteria group bacterium]|nr:DUF5615 family PIN-like protein [Patescibacteria group bacterium]